MDTSGEWNYGGHVHCPMYDRVGVLVCGGTSTFLDAIPRMAAGHVVMPPYCVPIKVHECVVTG